MEEKQVYPDIEELTDDEVISIVKHHINKENENIGVVKNIIINILRWLAFFPVAFVAGCLARGIIYWSSKLFCFFNLTKFLNSSTICKDDGNSFLADLVFLGVLTVISEAIVPRFKKQIVIIELSLFGLMLSIVLIILVSNGIYKNILDTITLVVICIVWIIYKIKTPIKYVGGEG